MIAAPFPSGLDLREIHRRNGTELTTSAFLADLGVSWEFVAMSFRKGQSGTPDPVWVEEVAPYFVTAYLLGAFDVQTLMLARADEAKAASR